MGLLLFYHWVMALARNGSLISPSIHTSCLDGVPIFNSMMPNPKSVLQLYVVGVQLA